MEKTKRQYTIGIDIGGTKMSAVLFDGEKVLNDSTLATPKDSLDHFLIMISALVDPLKERAQELKIKIQGVGLGVAGVLDYKEGKVLKSPNITLLDNVKIAELVSGSLEMPVIMDNDAKCFVRAEALLGAGKKFSNVFGITLGTGIGGGWWINNDVYKGAHGGAGEPGEMIIDFTNKIGLEAAYHKLTQNNPAQIAEEAYRGDVLAEKTFFEVGEFLGMAFANIVNLIDPEMIVVGGGVVESSDLFLSHAKKSMRAYIMSSESRKRIKLVKGKLGKHAGAIGAALLPVDRRSWIVDRKS